MGTDALLAKCEMRIIQPNFYLVHILIARRYRNFQLQRKGEEECSRLSLSDLSAVYGQGS